MAIIQKNSEIIAALGRYSGTNPNMLVCKSSKKKLIADVVISSDIRTRVICRKVNDGLMFVTYFGAKIPVKDKPQVLDKINSINEALIRGKFVIDKDNDLAFKNFVCTELGLEENSAIREFTLGVKMFHAYIGEIISVLSEDKEEDSEFTIISAEDDEEDEAESNDKGQN